MLGLLPIPEHREEPMRDSKTIRYVLKIRVLEKDFPFRKAYYQDVCC